MNDFALLGTLINVLLVLLGSGAGVIVKRVTKGKGTGERSKRFSDAAMSAIGLCTLLIGITGAIKGAVNGQISSAVPAVSGLASENTLVIIISMVIGVIIGELIDIDKWVNKLGDKLQKPFKDKENNIAEGFVTASLIVCVGAMSIVGSLESGLNGNHSIQITKGVLDVFSTFILASTMGVGVMFSAAFVLVYQGSISLLANWIAPFLTNDVIICMTAVGSLLIIALGLNILGIKKLKIINYVPAMFLPIALIPLYDAVHALLSKF